MSPWTTQQTHIHMITFKVFNIFADMYKLSFHLPVYRHRVYVYKIINSFIAKRVSTHKEWKYLISRINSHYFCSDLIWQYIVCVYNYLSCWKRHSPIWAIYLRGNIFRVIFVWWLTKCKERGKKHHFWSQIFFSDTFKKILLLHKFFLIF